MAYITDDTATDPSAACATCTTPHACKSIRWKERPCEQQALARKEAIEQLKQLNQSNKAPWQLARVEETDPTFYHAHQPWCESRAGLIFRPDRCSCGLIPAKLPTPAAPAAPVHTPPSLPTGQPGLIDNPRHAFFVRRLTELGFYDRDSDYNGMIGHAVEKLSAVHAREGHSGMSHHIVMALWNQLHEEYANTPLPVLVTEGPVTAPLNPDQTLPNAILTEIRREGRAAARADDVELLKEGRGRDFPKEVAEGLGAIVEKTKAEFLQTFTSGAKSSEQKLRYDLIPFHIFMDRLAKRYTTGAVKYGEYNWQKGLTERAYVLDRANHMLKHVTLAVEKIRSGMQMTAETLPINHLGDQRRDDYDDDLAAAMWGLIFLMAAQRGSAEL